MEKIFKFAQKFPVVVIILILAGSALAVFNLQDVWVDSSIKSMMMKDDPDQDFYEETLEIFGSDAMMMIYVEDKNLFSVEKLAALEQLVNDLSDEKKVPGIQRVDSLFSVNNIKGYPDYLDNNPLMDYPPETEEEAKKIKADALSNPVMVGNLVSEDGQKTVINLYLKPINEDDDKNATVNIAKGVAGVIRGKDGKGGYENNFDKVFEIGGPYIVDTLTGLIIGDMSTLMPISFAILLIMLIITMGSPSAAILPFITSSLSILFTFGFMGALKLPLNLLTFIVPVLVIVIGSTEDVHILSEYQEGLHIEGSRKPAIRFMARTIGTAILLTSLTTFLGFLSIAINRVIVLIQFGIIAGFALFINPLTTCLISPVYLSLFGAKSIRNNQKKKKDFVTRFFNRFSSNILIVIKKYKVITFIILIGGAIIIGVFSFFIKVDNDTVSYFKKDSELIKRMQKLHDELAGAQTFFVRIYRDKTYNMDAAIGSKVDETIVIDESTGDDEVYIDESTGDDEVYIDESTGDDEIFIDESTGDDEVYIDESTGDDTLPASDTGVMVNQTEIKKDSTANLFKDPQYMKLISDIQFKIDSGYNFDKSISIANYIRMMHKEMNVGRPGTYDTTPDVDNPDSKDLIAQYALNLHQDEISSYINFDWSEANILVRHNITSSSEIKEVLVKLNKEIAGIIYKIDPYLQFKITGENILVNKASDSIATSQVTGLGLLLASILVIMSILFINIKAGLLSLIPNVFPIAIFFGLMGIFKIPLNIGTCMVAAIAIGISVDDTIHFMTRYNKEMRELQNQDKAINVVIKSEIKPIISTSIALMMGFAVLGFSNLIPILYFGILSAIVMICALVADLLLTPILLTSVQLINITDMAKMKLASELKESPIFTGMSMYEIKKFALMGRVVAREKDEYIMQTGDTDHNMYILLSGKVHIERKDPKSGKHHFITSLGIGAVLGEISLLRNVPRTADVRVEEAASYLEIDWDGLMRIQKSSKKISLKLYRNMARVLGERLVNMTNIVEENKEGTN